MGQSRSILAVVDRQSPVKDQLQRFDQGVVSPVARVDVNLGNVNEIIGKFGGADKLRHAVNELQSLLYAA